MKKKVLSAAFIAMIFCASCGIPNAQNTASSASAAESADFSGEWSEEAEGFTVIDIWKDDYGLWHGEISRSDMDDSASFWSFSGTASGSEITYTDMKLIRGSYDEEGEVTEEAVYEDGSGVISLNDGKLYWRDDKENAAEGLSFIHTGDY